MSPPPSRNASLDALRVLSLLGIVALHVAGGGFTGNKATGFIVDEMSRFAVPVFFLLSAYFWKDADLAYPVRLTLKVARRVAPAFLLILALTLALRMIERPGRLGFEPTIEGTALLLWTGGPAFHLWFLPALILGTLVVSGLTRLAGLRTAAAVALLLYLVGTLIGAYARPLIGHGFPFWMDRNGLFFAPIFLVAGVLLRRHRQEIAALSLPAIAAATAIFALLHLAEGGFVTGRYPMGHDYSLSTLGYGIAVAMLFMRLELRGAIWSTLGQATFGAYLIHLLMMHVLANHLGLGKHSWAMIALAFSASLGLSLAWRAGRAKLAAAPVGV